MRRRPVPRHHHCCCSSFDLDYLQLLFVRNLLYTKILTADQQQQQQQQYGLYGDDLGFLLGILLLYHAQNGGAAPR